MRRMPLFTVSFALLISLCLLSVFLPRREKSDLENRMLTVSPPAPLSARFSEDFERFAADQLPGRDRWVMLHALTETLQLKSESGGVILSAGEDGRPGLLIMTDGYKDNYVRRNASALRDIADGTGKRVILLAVPTAAYLLKDLSSPRLTDEGALIKTAAGQIETVVPAYPSGGSSGPAYYRTDHHWTEAGAWCGYLAACEALGLDPVTVDPSNDIRILDGFYGSLYARFPSPLIPADSLSWYQGTDFTLFIGDRQMDGWIDRDALGQRDKYAALFYGNHAEMTLINENVPSGTLFVIKDSYANALLPFLAAHYHRIVAVDPRYFSADIIEAVKASQGDAVLCVYGLNTLATGRTIELMEGL